MPTRSGRREQRARACGTKKRFTEEGDAERAAELFAVHQPLLPPKRAYRCRYCRAFHVGRAPVPGEMRRPR